MTEIRCLYCNLPVQLPDVDNVRYTSHAIVHVDCDKAKRKQVLDKKQSQRLP